MDPLPQITRADELRSRSLEQAVRVTELTSAEELEALFHDLPVAVLVAQAPSGRIVACNAAGRALWGEGAECGPGYRGFHADGRRYEPGEWPLVRALRSGEHVDGEEVQVEGPDGRRRILRVSAVPIRDAAGRITLAVATGHDVTETSRHLEWERFLGRASEVLSASLDYQATVQRLAELCVQSLAHYCLVHVEQRGEIRALGVASSGPLPEAIVRERLHHLPVDPLGAHPIAETVRSGELRLVARVSDEGLMQFAGDAERLEMLREARVASVLMVPLRVSGRTLGVITLVRTAAAPPFSAEDAAPAEALGVRVAHAVDNARLYREAREAVRAREETMSVVSHDLRNSLHAALLSVDLLLDVAPAFSPEGPAWRRMSAVRRSLQHMHRLVQDLLEADRVGRGGLPLQRERVESGSLAREVEETFGPVAREAGVRFEVRLPEPAPPLLADPVRLMQVLSNLVGNAVHATPPGGRVELAVEPDPDAGVRLRVSDTGAGMTEEELSRVFDRFYQGAGARRTGVGLGLTIARGIVEAHGGRIWAESRPGEGSTFSLTIPSG